MPRLKRVPASEKPPKIYWGTEVTPRLIRRFARQVAEQFDPDKIILFGSHAYGTPHADSDVDLLVIMPARDQISQAVKIRMAIPAPFPMDLLVRSPEQLARQLRRGDAFLTEVMTSGKVLHEQRDGVVGSKGRSGLSSRRTSRPVRRRIS